MPDLRFQVERGQLRGLARYGVALGLAGGLLTVAWWVSRRGMLGAWAVALDVAALLALYAWLAFRRAYSELTPAGIRSRGLAGTRTVPWERVRAVVLAPSRRTVTLAVLRDDGRRVVLGAPVDGGVMPDPDFDRKVEQIQAYVDRVDSRDRTRADRLIGPGVGPTAEDLGRPSWPVRLGAAIWWVVLPALAAGMLLYLAVDLPSEVRAARGHGVPGIYLVTGTSCRPVSGAGQPSRCTVVGTFLSDDDRVFRDRARLVAPAGVRRVGDTVRAQWVSVITSDVYPDPYSGAWYREGGVAAGCVLLLGWWVRNLRGRWKRRAEHPRR